MTHPCLQPRLALACSNRPAHPPSPNSDRRPRVCSIRFFFKTAASCCHGGAPWFLLAVITCVCEAKHGKQVERHDTAKSPHHCTFYAIPNRARLTHHAMDGQEPPWALLAQPSGVDGLLDMDFTTLLDVMVSVRSSVHLAASLNLNPAYNIDLWFAG